MNNTCFIPRKLIVSIGDSAEFYQITGVFFLIRVEFVMFKTSMQ